MPLMPRVLSEICNQILIPFESIDNVLMAEIQLIIQYFPIKLSYQIAHFYVTCLHSPFHWWRIHFECFVAIINWITMQCICFYEHGEWCVDVCGGHKPCRGHKSNKMTIWHFTIDQIRGDWTSDLIKMKSIHCRYNIDNALIELQCTRWSTPICPFY